MNFSGLWTMERVGGEKGDFVRDLSFFPLRFFGKPERLEETLDGTAGQQMNLSTRNFLPPEAWMFFFFGFSNLKIRVDPTSPMVNHSEHSQVDSISHSFLDRTLNVTYLHIISTDSPLFGELPYSI